MDQECASVGGDEMIFNLQDHPNETQESVPTTVIIEGERGDGDEEEEKELEDELDAAAISKVRSESFFKLYEGP
eukprot:CAMPEP_0170506462 /NCGR_PEP_ID=MMETSP0208-20121228/55020_1 /TAXON_ID=197538 /ORGANISM="Strombidium inclinatum, Strain S3" /LENGTH=73 /DNA_ID=CAMNT_0010788015 /DNA_START=1421 /DNA_END=1642 /DNA_ORIENTATION=-